VLVNTDRAFSRKRVQYLYKLYLAISQIQNWGIEPGSTGATSSLERLQRRAQHKVFTFACNETVYEIAA
jgi:hypothetical protein